VATPPPSLKARALQWLAQREQSRTELRRKLLALARRRAAIAGEAVAHEGQGATGPTQAAADPAAEVDALLDWLAAHRHLSDERFVESRVHARAARYGNLRIRQELAQHGTAIDAATAEQLKSSELARAHAVWARKFGGEPASDAAGRLRQMRFLAGRGFSADVIRRVINGDDDGADELS
jgi:regulatory protein